jgi:hypothetical protein
MDDEEQAISTGCRNMRTPESGDGKRASGF